MIVSCSKGLSACGAGGQDVRAPFSTLRSASAQSIHWPTPPARPRCPPELHPDELSPIQFLLPATLHQPTQETDLDCGQSAAHRSSIRIRIKAQSPPAYRMRDTHEP